MTLNGKSEVERVETRTDNPVLGDMVTETTYSGYKDLGEIKSDVMFPSRIVQKQGGYPVMDLTISKITLNEALEADRFKLEAPAGAEVVHVGENSEEKRP